MNGTSSARGRCIVIELVGDGATIAEGLRLFAAALTNESPAPGPPELSPALVESPPRRAIAAAPTPARRGRVAAGSLEDRILGLATQPATLAALVDGAGARKGDVVKTVKQLVADGRLEQTGKSRATRYTAA